MVEAHDGDIRADSTLGKGGVFTIELPLKKNESGAVSSADYKCTHETQGIIRFFLVVFHKTFIRKVFSFTEQLCTIT